MFDSKCLKEPALDFVFSILTIGVIAWAQLAVAADSSVINQDFNESAVDVSNRVTATIAALQQNIDTTETAYGPFSKELLGPLQQMVSLQIGLESYQQVDRLIERYLQINRINTGPSTLSQVPALVEQIANDIRLENWESINDRFQFITWLYAQHSNFRTVELLSLLNEFAAWNLAAVYIDLPELRVEHFVAYRLILENTLEFLEGEYGNESARLVPWLYQAALMEYRGVAFQRTRDELRAGPKAGSMQDALIVIRRIQSIVDQHENLEARAMAIVYEADFVKLANDLNNRNFGSSEKLYKQAVEKFRAGGVSEQEVSSFFTQSTVLPMNSFHPSIAQAMQEQRPKAGNIDRNIFAEEAVEKAMEFTAWNESLPFARRPDKTSLITGLSTELSSILLQFSVDKNGNVRNVKSIASYPQSAKVRAYARDAVTRFTFRSDPTANRWRSNRRAVDLVYRYTP